MNEITKELVQRILDLGVEEIEQEESGDLLYKKCTIISCFGDVNYSSWLKTTLRHDYFRFTGFGNVYIETQEQANEFYEIVCNYFCVKPTLQEKEKMLDDKIEELSKYILELAIKENRFDINIYYHGNVENFSIWIKRKKGSTLEDYRKEVYLDGVIDSGTRLERKEKTISVLCEMIEEIKRRQSQC